MRVAPSSFVALFCLCCLLLAALAFGLRPKVYQAETTMQVPSMLLDHYVMQSLSPAAAFELEAESLTNATNQARAWLESSVLLQRVADRLTGDELHQFMAPYEKGAGEVTPSPVEILDQNRLVIPQRHSLLVKVVYLHPDRFIAARVANYFAGELLSYLLDTRSKEQMHTVEELKSRVNTQSKKVADLTTALQAVREKHGPNLQQPNVLPNPDATLAHELDLNQKILNDFSPCPLPRSHP